MTTRIGFAPDSKKKLGQKSDQYKQMYKHDDPFQIDKWYDCCKEHTFETKSIPLTIEQAKAIKFMCHYFKVYKQHEIATNECKGKGITLNYDHSLLQASLKASLNSTNLSYHWGESFNWKALTDKNSEQYLNPLKQLEQNINNIMDELKCDNGIFIRLNTRSPKDSAIEGMKTFELLFQELKQWNNININVNKSNEEAELEEKKHDMIDMNTQCMNLKNDQICSSFYRTSMKSLSVNNGYEAIELLCRSYQRVFTDLNLAMLKQGEENLKLCCVIRKWYNIVDPIWEFRLIVKDYKPTALTQYHKTVVIPNGDKYKTFLQERILKEHALISHKLSKELKDYTIDFAVVLKNRNLQNVPIDIGNIASNISDKKEELAIEEDPIDRVYLIELNHAPPLAGTALFDFMDAQDKKIMDGEQPFQFRLHKSNKDVNYDILENILPDNTIKFVKVLQGKYKYVESVQEAKMEEATPLKVEKSQKNRCVVL